MEVHTSGHTYLGDLLHHLSGNFANVVYPFVEASAHCLGCFQVSLLDGFGPPLQAPKLGH